MLNWLRNLFSEPEQKPAKPAHAPQANSAPQAPAAPAAPLPPYAPSREVLAAAQQRSASAVFLERSEVNAAFTSWLFEANQNTDTFTNPVEQEILDALDKIVKSNQSGATLVRRMPGVIPQLLQSLRTENFSGTQLAKKLSHDVVLVGAVIRIANSSFFSPGQTITSIEHAVLVIGQAGLRQLITSVAFQPIIDLNSGHFTKLIAGQLWEQSERAAVASRMLAGVHKVDPFEAFLAGLIQNVGLLASLRVIDQMADENQAIGSETFCNALINYGRLLSCSIGREWHFPEAVTKAIEDQGQTGKNAVISPMGKVLAAGSHVSKLHLLSRHEKLPDPNHYIKNLSATETESLDFLNSLKEGEI
ncbi:MAG: HDOD domain-containing protein [Burkholderiales bacterium]|nr:HDOD domain-containing protein [Burkholderiales bacterium]